MGKGFVGEKEFALTLASWIVCLWSLHILFLPVQQPFFYYLVMCAVSHEQERQQFTVYVRPQFYEIYLHFDSTE